MIIRDRARARTAARHAVVFIAFFAFSQGAVIWVYLTEIFPTAVAARTGARQRHALGHERA